MATFIKLPIVYRALLVSLGIPLVSLRVQAAAEIRPPNVTSVTNETPVEIRVVISEVHPTGSNSTYAADWFEVTNVGTTAVDISGWTVDDNSNGTGKIALRGVSSIPAGESVVFCEGAADASTDLVIFSNFAMAWFGRPTLPVGFLIGSYGGAGIGLSSSADALNIFDSSGQRLTGLSFGAATLGVTFDNWAGIGRATLPLPTISTVSVAGVHGAYLSANGLQMGSPGITANSGAPAGTFAAWLAAKGYVSTGIDTDSDGDGLVDRLEYFFNQNPNSANDHGHMPHMLSAGGTQQLDFTRLTRGSGTLELSSDLLSWTKAITGLDYTEVSSVVNGDETAVSYNLLGSGPSAPGGSAAYLTANISAPAGATLAGIRVVNEGLVGVGRISGENVDSFGETQGAASGLAISDWAWDGSRFTGKFNVLPDRGYNSGAIFSNYAARLHRVDFSFSPYYGAGPVAQNQILPSYVSSTKFTYQDGAKVKFTTGLNPTATSQLMGQTVGTVTAANGPGGAQESLLSFDAEAVYLFADGSGYVSDEYGAYIARFNPLKQITGMTQLPEAARPHNPSTTLNFNATSTPTNGRRNNQGLEGLSVTPDGTRLFAMLQSATVQDTNGSQQQTRNHARLFIYDVAGDNRETPVLIGEYVVKLPQIDLDGNGSGLDGTAAQSEIIAIGNSSFLMLPRDGNGLGKGTAAPITFKSVQLVDFVSATNILGLYDGIGQQVSPGGTLLAGVSAAATAEVINLRDINQLAKFGFNLNPNNTLAADSNTLNEKLEGMALVPDLSTPQANDFFLFIANDNDFQASDVKMLNASGNFMAGPIDGRLNVGVTNDAVFYAYRITIDTGAKKFFRFSVK